jgi:hypothetical protein
VQEGEWKVWEKIQREMWTSEEDIVNIMRKGMQVNDPEIGKSTEIFGISSHC